MYSRRTFLKISASITALVAGGYFFKSSGVPKVKHILSSASHERLGITLSLSKTTSKLELLLNGSNLIEGRKTDKEGKHWQFLSNKLISNESYELQLISENEPIYKRWTIKTFPDPEAKIKKLSLFHSLVQAVAMLLGLWKRVFQALLFRQNIFNEGLSKNPDFAIAIGDHVYWDLRGKVPRRLDVIVN